MPHSESLKRCGCVIYKFANRELRICKTRHIIMAPKKLYVGRKIRDIREQHKATQSGFAERLGISTSYLNQIENNQRPVSAAVLLALAENYQIDIGAISLVTMTGCFQLFQKPWLIRSSIITSQTCKS